MSPSLPSPSFHRCCCAFQKSFLQASPPVTSLDGGSRLVAGPRRRLGEHRPTSNLADRSIRRSSIRHVAHRSTVASAVRSLDTIVRLAIRPYVRLSFSLSACPPVYRSAAAARSLNGPLAGPVVSPPCTTTIAVPHGVAHDSMGKSSPASSSL